MAFRNGDLYVTSYLSFPDQSPEQNAYSSSPPNLGSVGQNFGAYTVFPEINVQWRFFLRMASGVSFCLAIIFSFRKSENTVKSCFIVHAKVSKIRSSSAHTRTSRSAYKPRKPKNILKSHFVVDTVKMRQSVST